MSVASRVVGGLFLFVAGGIGGAFLVSRFGDAWLSRPWELHDQSPEGTQVGEQGPPEIGSDGLPVESEERPTGPVDGWELRDRYDELSGKSITFLMNRKWSQDRTVQAETIIEKCYEDPFGRRVIDAAISTFDRTGSGKPLKSKRDSYGRESTIVTVSVDGGQSQKTEAIPLREYSNHVTVTFEVRGGSIYNNTRLPGDKSPDEFWNSGHLAGDYRIKLAANDGAEVVVFIPFHEQRFVAALNGLCGGNFIK